MKLCITSQGTELSSPVDERFGRARYFIIYDDETNQFEVIDNEQNVNAAGGAGVQAATTVADAGCQWVISGHMGPKALSVLRAAEVKVAVGAAGTVAEAVADFRKGRLDEAADADVPERW